MFRLHGVEACVGQFDDKEITVILIYFISLKYIYIVSFPFVPL